MLIKRIFCREKVLCKDATLRDELRTCTERETLNAQCDKLAMEESTKYNIVLPHKYSCMRQFC